MWRTFVQSEPPELGMNYVAQHDQTNIFQFGMNDEVNFFYASTLVAECPCTTVYVELDRRIQSR